MSGLPPTVPTAGSRSSAGPALAPVAVVTGAAHGIGLAVARRLAADGFRPLAVDVHGERLAAAPLPPGTIRLVHDIAEGAGPVLDALAAAGGTVGCLVNNVGVAGNRPFLDLPLTVVERTLRVNILGTWVLTRAVVARMIDAGRPGPIVFVLSLHARRVRAQPDYSVSKAGLGMLAQELAVELGPLGIRVNSVSPGAVDTWSRRVDDPAEHRRRSEAVVPLGRLGRPDDVAEAVSFLCDEDRAAYVTGADLRVDGGLDQFNWIHHLYGLVSPPQ